MARFVYKAHRWLAVSAGLFTLLWFVSGIVMLLPANLFVTPPAGEGWKGFVPAFKEIRLSVPQAIAAVEKAAGSPVEVTGFQSKVLREIILYQISTRKHGTFLIDAMNGERIEINVDTAWRVATLATGVAPYSMGQATRVEKHDSDYLYGPLPAYKVPVNDGYGTMLFVTGETGEVRSTNRMGRVRGFIAGMHTFDFLRPVAGARVVRALMLLFALAGTAMSLFGGWILWMQFRNWRQMRRQSA